MGQQQNLNLHIEELHLHGISGVSIDRLHAEIERELTHKIQKGGLPHALKHNQNVYSTAKQQLTADITSLAPAEMAEHIAQNLYQGWQSQPQT